MASITHRGKTVHSSGELPALGTKAPDFLLTKGDLSDVRLADFGSRVKVLNIVPSLDTGTCAMSARSFDAKIGEVPGALVLTISRDLPFAQSRFCKAEGITHVVTLSALRDLEFGKAWGVQLVDGPMAGLLARAVVVLDEANRVVYTQLVPDISQEPDYASALAAAKKAAASGY